MASNALRSAKCILNPILGSLRVASRMPRKPFTFPSLSRRSVHFSALLYADPVAINMPAMSPTMQEGTIVKWHKKEGETVNAGDVLCEIQTDKAVVAVEAEDDGVLAKIVIPENTKDVKIGTLIALVVGEGEDWQNVKVPTQTGEAKAVEVKKDVQPAKEPVKTAVGTNVKSSTPQNYGPAVRLLLELYRIKANSLTGSGPGGRLLKGDVLDYITANKMKPAPVEEKPLGAVTAKTAEKRSTTPVAQQTSPTTKPSAVTAKYTDIELSNMRKTIAKRLTQSKTTIPHSYCTTDCCLDNLAALRANLQKEGVKVSVNDFLIKAVSISLRQHPNVNAVWTNDGPKLVENIDISVAVATDNGLITPIVTDAIGRGVQDISKTVKDLAGRARENKLKLHEFQGGSFTISNLGMFGISSFSAIINPPQACILAVGGSRTVLDPETIKGKTYMSVTLCSDTRIVHDELAAQFLDTFKAVIEEPMLMLNQEVPADCVEPVTQKIEPSMSSLFAK